MRRLLGVLRPGTDECVQAPQPELGQLRTLVAQTEQAGLPVLLCIQGEPRSLPSGIEPGAYRIVQEALTNTLKHAGPSQASVVVGYQGVPLRIVSLAANGLAASPARCKYVLNVSALEGVFSGGYRCRLGVQARTWQGRREYAVGVSAKEVLTDGILMIGVDTRWISRGRVGRRRLSPSDWRSGAAAVSPSPPARSAGRSIRLRCRGLLPFPSARQEVDRSASSRPG
jgi:hypothetical protein